MSYERMLHLTKHDLKILSHFYDHRRSYVHEVRRNVGMSYTTLIARIQYLTQNDILRQDSSKRYKIPGIKYYIITDRGISLVELLMKLNE
jgi:DNA-binding HxlR family transcriptional regulator